jgi:hypothetical protein
MYPETVPAISHIVADFTDVQYERSAKQTLASKRGAMSEFYPYVK